MQFQDPRLLGDAYLTTGQQYSRVHNNGVESPTYIQLENASVPTRVSSTGYATGIYSPPVSYSTSRHEYLAAPVDQHIYSLKSAPGNGR